MVDLETYVENIDKQYIKVLKFINDLYKHARPQVSLKNILEYLGNNYSFIDLALYQKFSYSYVLVESTGLLEHENSTEVIQSIYDCLDNGQIGISYSSADMEPFEDFYFKFSEVSKFYEYVDTNSSKKEGFDTISPKHEVMFPNQYQRMTMLYDYFTPHQACCFIAGLHPSFNGSDDDLEIAEFIIEGGFKSGKLILDDDGQINADNLKAFLYSKNWIMTGFNDLLNNEPPKPLVENKKISPDSKFLEAAHARIKELERQESIGSLMMETPIAKKCDPKDIERINQELRAAKIKIADLTSQLKQANTALADVPAANTRIKQQEQDIKRLNDQLSQQADLLADKHLYDWQTMDKNQYPPELHLAMVIWREYYQVDAMKYITQFDSGRFNRISTKLNLSNGNLKDRIRTLLTPLESKLKSPSLIASFKVIDTIHTDKLEQD